MTIAIAITLNIINDILIKILSYFSNYTVYFMKQKYFLRKASNDNYLMLDK